MPYTGAHVVGQLQLLLFSGLAFFLMLNQFRRTLTITLDLDWFYRRFGKVLALEFADKGAHAHGGLRRLARRRVAAFIAGLYRHHGPQGILARSWPTGSMALWAAVLLAAYLLLYFV